MVGFPLIVRSLVCWRSDFETDSKTGFETDSEVDFVTDELTYE